MGHINLKKLKTGFVVENKIKFPESVQDRIVQFLNAGIYKNFFPVSVEKQKKKKAVLKCEIYSLSQLSEILSSMITKNDFLDVVLQIVFQIKSCEKYLLNAINIELNCDRIFYEHNTKSIKCIYWPMVNNRSYIKPRDFFKEMMNIANFRIGSDSEWIREYNLFLNSLKPFSINNFEKLITKLQGKKIHTAEIAPVSTILTSNFSEDSINSTDNMLNKDQVYDPLKATAFRENKTKHIKYPQSANKKSFSYSDKNLSNKGLISMASLIRAINNEKITINKRQFVIGKSESDTDYSINNPAISRVHAAIHIKDNNYYIQDNNSTNKTFVNKKAILPYKDIKIKDGDILKLANETFIFHC